MLAYPHVRVEKTISFSQVHRSSKSSPNEGSHPKPDFGLLTKSVNLFDRSAVHRAPMSLPRTFALRLIQPETLRVHRSRTPRINIEGHETDEPISGQHLSSTAMADDRCGA